MRYDLYEYLTTAPVRAETDDSYTVRVSARDALMCLPSPRNVERNPDLIPDHQVTVLMSKGKTMPRRIVRLLETSEDRAMFAEASGVSLSGLCLNGRGLPSEFFVHKGLMGDEPSGREEFEQVFWHEYIHAAEGIRVTHGQVTRIEPWSFRLQATMLAFDKMDGDAPQPPPDLPDSLRAHIAYLHRGLDLQQHASEVFARVGELMLYRIRDAGDIPQDRLSAVVMLQRILFREDQDASRQAMLKNDFLCALGSFGARAQLLAMRSFPQMLRRAARMYGCAV